MPGRILGFDIGRPAPSSSQTTSTLTRQSSNSVKPPNSPVTNAMDHFKRPSIGKKTSSDGKSPKLIPSASSTSKHVKFEIVTESPPALFLDDAQRSTGALYSIKLHMTVKDRPITLRNFTIKLEAISSTKRPVADKCKNCARQVTSIKDWKLISENTTFQPGTYGFPVSHLLPGHLPITTRGLISSIEYQFVARAESDKGELFELTRPLEIQRAIRPGLEKTSIRVFPPTNLALNVTLPSVIHTMGEFNVYAKMTGLTTKQNDTQTRWRLRKLDWRIEEQETSISPACPKHAAKLGGEGKGVMHEQSRVIGDKEVKSGWKTDFEAGEVEGEFLCSIDRMRKPNLDVESPNGLKITHTLVLEMIIAEEWAPNKKPKSATPTGVARVLRTQFNLTVTERAGMGIAWDDEMPPLYEDVPASPPAYLHLEVYDGDDLNEDVEHLHLG